MNWTDSGSCLLADYIVNGVEISISDTTELGSWICWSAIVTCRFINENPIQWTVFKLIEAPLWRQRIIFASEKEPGHSSFHWLPVMQRSNIRENGNLRPPCPYKLCLLGLSLRTLINEPQERSKRQSPEFLKTKKLLFEHSSLIASLPALYWDNIGCTVQASNTKCRRTSYVKFCDTRWKNLPKKFISFRFYLLSFYLFFISLFLAYFLSPFISLSFSLFPSFSWSVYSFFSLPVTFIFIIRYAMFYQEILRSWCCHNVRLTGVHIVPLTPLHREGII